MTVPPKYPRIPHIAPGLGVGEDDVVLSGQERERLLRARVRVEEKLDGANVAVWLDDGVPQVATRGGADTVDRGGQRGRLRAWAAGHADELAEALSRRYALYGEWLMRRHAVPYDRLPSPLIGLDVIDRRSGAFLPVTERDAVLRVAGVPSPPIRFEGVLGSLEAAHRLLGASTFGDAPAEGVVIRPLDRSGGRVAKLVDPRWERPSDAEWAQEGVQNTVMETA